MSFDEFCASNSKTDAVALWIGCWLSAKIWKSPRWLIFGRHLKCDTIRAWIILVNSQKSFVTRDDRGMIKKIFFRPYLSTCEKWSCFLFVIPRTSLFVTTQVKQKVFKEFLKSIQVLATIYDATFWINFLNSFFQHFVWKFSNLETRKLWPTSHFASALPFIVLKLTLYTSFVDFCIFFL